MDRDELAVVEHKMHLNYDVLVVLAVVVVIVNVENDAVADNGIVVADAVVADKLTNNGMEIHIRVVIVMVFVAYLIMVLVEDNVALHAIL